MNVQLGKVCLLIFAGICWHLMPSAGYADPRFRYEYRPAHIGTARQAECHGHIIRALKSSIQGRAKVHIGSFQNIDSLFERAEMFDYDVAGIMAWLDGQKAQRPNHPIFKRSIAEINRKDSTSELFVCVLRKGCQFKQNAAAIHINSTAAVIEEDFTKTKPPFVPAHLRRMPACLGHMGLKETLHMIVVRVPEPTLSLETSVTRSAGTEARRDLLDAIGHETTHAADYDLFSDWVLANYFLITSKRFSEVDDLFLKVTRERNGQLVVDHGFSITFLESRAYAVSDYVQSQHYKDTEGRFAATWDGPLAALFGGSLRNSPRKDYANQAVEVIRTAGGGWFLQRNDVTNVNIFDFAIKLGNRFDRIIKLAGLPDRFE